MELKINEIAIPEKIEFNYEELKQELTEKVEMYTNLVYTDDQIKEAKADKSQLNKLKKALNDERIRREREYMKPFTEFKTQINEIIAIIDKPVAVIDSQVKAYEQKCREEKKQEIITYYESLKKPEWLKIEQFASTKWLNASCSMKIVKEEIDAKVEEVKQNIETIEKLPEFSFEAFEDYTRHLDINHAIAEGQRLADIQRRKEEQERLRKEAEERRRIEEEQRKAAEEQARKEAELQKQEEPAEVAQEEIGPEPIENHRPDPVEAEPQQWVRFAALLTTSQALELKEFFESRAIEFKPA